MRSIAALGLAFGALLLVPATADDIVWPTYAHASYPTDPALSCSRLQDTIAHVNADIALLSKARDRVTEIIRNRHDFDTSAGRIGDRRFTYVTQPAGGDLYMAAREQISASRDNAFARLTYLDSLVPACKDTPAPADPPKP